MKARFAIYGSRKLTRVWCPRCRRNSFVIDGVMVCCDKKISDGIEIIGFKQEVESENKRTKLSRALKEKVLMEQDYKCIYCQTDLHENLVHFDHLVPWAKNGDNSYENIYASCKRCNLMKSDLIFNNLDEARIYILQRLENEVSKLRETIKRETK